MRRWYCLQAKVLAFLWRRVPLLTWVYDMRPDMRVTCQLAWVGGPTFLDADRNFRMAPDRTSASLLFRACCKVLVVPCLVYAGGIVALDPEDSTFGIGRRVEEVRTNGQHK